MEVDAIDLKILKQLQNNARLSHQELADIVSLSPSACHRRVKILESKGIIENYQIKIDYAKLGYKIDAIVEIRLAQLTDEEHHAFIEQVNNFDEVINAYIITGDSNYILYVTTKDLEEYSNFIINKMNKVKGVVSMNSKIILSKIKQKRIF